MKGSPNTYEYSQGEIIETLKTVVGLDLAGVETRPSGFCILHGQRIVWSSLLYTNQEILTKVKAASPQIIAIDAPLSLPPGRKSIEQKTNIHLRECDKELLRKGIRFFTITLGPMRKLTLRGINLRGILESNNFRVIEVYPGGAQDILGIPRKQQGVFKLKKGLQDLGLRGFSSNISDHELDAATCAFVGKLFLEGKSAIYGTAEQGIVMPN